EGTAVLLLGAGPEAEQFIRAVERNPHAGFRVVGMLTRREDRVGQMIHGLDRRGRRPDKLVLVRSDMTGAEVQELLARAEDLQLPLVRVPVATDVRALDDDTFKPRPIAIDDLLGRPQARLTRVAMAAMIAERRVLVTGA